MGPDNPLNVQDAETCDGQECSREPTLVDVVAPAIFGGTAVDASLSFCSLSCAEATVADPDQFPIDREGDSFKELLIYQPEMMN